MIKIQDMSFLYPNFSNRSLKSLICSALNNSEKASSKPRLVLNDLNINIYSGERLGIIGPNGAGKSTLLKVVSKIYPPSQGSVIVQGKVACLFELATGFEMECTGWENIYTRATLLGMSRSEIEAKLHSIADFSELGEALDMPVKCYSSGMFVRLAFAVSTAIEPDILLLDEVIGAGDLSFTNKAKMRLMEMMEKSSIMLLVSHSLDSIEHFCNRAIWLDGGKIILDGSPRKVVNAYKAKYG